MRAFDDSCSQSSKANTVMKMATDLAMISVNFTLILISVTIYPLLVYKTSLEHYPNKIQCQDKYFLLPFD